ncbi:MAG: hypothetical protein AAF939_13155 [Planctomycetota bacterium]
MKPTQIFAGGVAGVLGAVIWAAIAYYANVEIGYIALGIGFLVGVAVAATGKNSATAGVLAVVITCVSICAGKYASIELSIQKAANDFAASTDVISDEDLISGLADKIAEDREDAGEEIAWPEVNDDSEVELPLSTYYPKDLWAEASEKFAGMSAEEKQVLKDERNKMMEEIKQAFGQALGNNVRQEAFLASFGFLDILFFGLGAYTAWGIASRDED